jgi:hypothetical protein
MEAGPLVGMVQMFPSELGPYMASALVATLYGSVVANLFCLPIADKLHGKLLDEETKRTLIIDGHPDDPRFQEAPPGRGRAGAGPSPAESRRWRRKNSAMVMAAATAFVTFADLMG